MRGRDGTLAKSKQSYSNNSVTSVLLLLFTLLLLIMVVNWTSPLSIDSNNSISKPLMRTFNKHNKYNKNDIEINGNLHSWNHNIDRNQAGNNNNSNNNDNSNLGIHMNSNNKKTNANTNTNNIDNNIDTVYTVALLLQPSPVATHEQADRLRWIDRQAWAQWIDGAPRGAIRLFASVPNNTIVSLLPHSNNSNNLDSNSNMKDHSSSVSTSTSVTLFPSSTSLDPLLRFHLIPLPMYNIGHVYPSF